MNSPFMNVLMFHDVVNDRYPKSGFTRVGAAQYVLRHDQFENIVEEAILTDDSVVFSFDDGGSSFFNVIAPALEKCGRRGVFCITTSFIGSPGFMTADQIVDLDRRGHVIASHSHTHPKIISELPYRQIQEEWMQSKEILESIVGHDITVASVPGGAVSGNVAKAMEEAGYRTIYTSEPTDIPYMCGEAMIMGRFTITHNSTPQDIRKLLSDKWWRRYLLGRYKTLRFSKMLLGSHYNTLKQFVLKLKR